MDDLTPSETFIISLLRGEFGRDFAIHIVNRANLWVVSFAGDQFKLGVAAGKTLDDAVLGLGRTPAEAPAEPATVIKIVGGTDRSAVTQ